MCCGGQWINYPGDVGTPTADMLLVKILFNSTISTEGSEFVTADIKNIYLMTTLKKMGIHKTAFEWHSTWNSKIMQSEKNGNTRWQHLHWSQARNVWFPPSRTASSRETDWTLEGTWLLPEQTSNRTVAPLDKTNHLHTCCGQFWCEIHQQKGYKKHYTFT